MSETTSSSGPSSEPETGPVTTAPPPAVPAAYVEQQPRSRLATVAAWVGIVAGVVFVVAVVFFSGFVLGARSGGHHGGWGHGGWGGDRDREFGVMHNGGPPMFPMGPRGEFGRQGPGGPGGPGGPNFGGPSQSQPNSPSTTAPRP